MSHFYDRAAIGYHPVNQNRLAKRTPQQVDGQWGLSGHWQGVNVFATLPPPIERIKQIQVYELNRGYGDVSYAGFFDSDGNTYAGRDPQWIGAHALSTNNVANIFTAGICWLEDKRGWTDGAVAGFKWWIDLFRLAHHGRTPQLYAHSWWHAAGGIITACPGADFRNVIGYLGGHV